MLPSGEEQRDGPCAHQRYDAAGEGARPLVTRLACQAQNPHACVVVVHHTALCRLPDQLLQCRSDQFCSSSHQIPLRRRRQRHSQLFLESFQSLKWHSCPVLQQGDHRHGRLIVLLRTRPIRFVGFEDLPAGVATQSLHFEYRCFQWCVPHKPHQRCRLFQAVHFSPAALWAKVAGMESGVCAGHPGGAAKRSGAVAPMTGRSRFAGFRFVGHRILRQNGTGLFRSPFPGQALRHGVDRGFQRLAFGLAQRRVRAAIDDLVQLFQVHVDPPSPRHIWLR